MRKVDLEPCVAPRWAAEGHSQTIIGYLMPSVKIKEEKSIWQIPLGDGDLLMAEYYQGCTDHIVLLFHGLSGSVESDYMQRMARIYLDCGHSVVLVNHRGCGAGKGLAKHPYHSGSADDIAKVIEYSKNRFPDLHHIAIGFSLSGNALLLLLTEPDKIKPDLAISVNPPVDLSRVSQSLNKGRNKIYDLQFVLKSCADVNYKKRLGLLTKPYPVSYFKSLRDFDSDYTAPAGGFASREDYYKKCSTCDKLDKIKTPTYILAAKDDPFIPWDSYLVANFSTNVSFHLETVGGHMGYLTAKQW
jgi:predicted alpha/beta-fold hydrolase